jgi:hypothetical protein
MGKKSSGINNPDDNSKILNTIFLVKILKFFKVDPGPGWNKIRIRDPGWNKIRILDPVWKNSDPG